LLLEREKTKHIKAKFFFIKDKVDDGEMQVIDCPTENMWLDVLTKPLQGMAFEKMRAALMNCSVNYEEDEESKVSCATEPVAGRGRRPSQPPQECVGKPRAGRDRLVGVPRIQRGGQPVV
jgi:hypothetical protein